MGIPIERALATLNDDPARDPITGDLAQPPAGSDPTPDAAFDRRAQAMIDRAIAADRERQKTERDAERIKADKVQTLACLQTVIDGNPGDDLDSVKLRSGVQDLAVLVHSDGMGDKTFADIVKLATDLQTARLQAILEKGGDGTADLPQTRPGNGADGVFSMGAFMRGLGDQVVDKGESFQGDELAGSPELEYAKQLLDKTPGAKDQFQALSRDAGPRQRVVPFPAMALHPDAIFAETYGTDAANQRQPTYRRDALVEFFRPMNVLGSLGVPMPMISNDMTLPRLSASLTAAWYAENGAITQGTVTVTPITTEPKRLGVFDSISWMLLAGGDAQFGVQPVVVMEMAAAVMQAKEAAVYGGAITNGPTGVRGTTGVNAKDLGSTDPTYADMLNMITILANLNIPVGMGRFAVNPTIRELLSTIQRFTTGSSILNDTAFREPGSGAGAGGIGSFGSAIMGTIAGHPCAVTTHIPTAAGGDTHMYFAVWPYVWCVDYSVAFLTIDDISSAVNGRTNITVNSYHDVAVRFPQAFNVVTHDISP